MAAPELGPWSPLTLESVVQTFSPASFRWWVSGGHALELHLQRSWRDHEDTDVGVVRSELSDVHEFLSHWSLYIAAAGQLTPWSGESLVVDQHQNNLWCRVTTPGPWVLDIIVNEGSDENWIYRRDASVQVPWEEAVLRTPDGIPYLAPELQLLYKSKGLRPKDSVDATEVIPSLGSSQHGFLARVLPPGHPWHRLLA